MRMRMLTALVLLAGCGPLVQIGGNDKAPAALMTLRATAAPRETPATFDRARAVLVLPPASVGALQTLRVPVIVTDTSLAYLTGATWAEQPNRQLAHVLADTLAANGVATLDPKQAPLAPGRTLTGTLVECSLDIRDAAHVVVRIRLDAALSTSAGAQAVRRFDASEPVASQSPADVAVALNVAANRLAGDVATWVRR